MHWDILAHTSQAEIRRSGRFLVVDLQTPHRAITTSTRNGGQSEVLRHLVNHQSCEAAGHDARFEHIHRRGEHSYHDEVCAEIGVPPDATALMTTAANMNYAAIVSKRHGEVDVMAIVTAGVETNATCAGDPATWHETTEGFAKLAAEGKSAALARLAVPSCYSADLATGTGTDQYCVAAPIDGARPLTSASPHMKFGEIIGLAVREATLEALRWQNGLEPSMTRAFFRTLGRFGITETVLFDGLAEHLDAADLELLRRNSKAAFHEPLVGAAAHALAAVLDRARHGTLPQACVRDAVIQQAAMLGANLAAKPDHWPDFRRRLHAVSGEPKTLVVAAIALGWSEKWRPG
jgi:adenosylcobinamide amidohydrolase